MKRNVKTPCPNCNGYPTEQDECGGWYSCYTCGDTGWLTISRFAVSYEIVTEDSAGFGEVDESGWLNPAENCLRDAVEDVLRTRTNEVDGIIDRCAERTHDGLRITIYNGLEYRSGERENRTLHVVCTPASAGRIARLLGVPLES